MSSYSDESLLKFVSEFIAYNFDVQDNLDQLNTNDHLDLAEAITIAETVEGTTDFERGFRFPLPGLASYRTINVHGALNYLATLWHRSQAEWKRRGRAISKNNAEMPLLDLVCAQDFDFLWAQVSVVCESVLVRDGTLEEMQHCGPHHRAMVKYYAKALALAAGEAREACAHQIKREAK